MYFGDEQHRSSEELLEDNLKRAFPLGRETPLTFQTLLDRLARNDEDEARDPS